MESDIVERVICDGPIGTMQLSERISKPPSCELSMTYQQEATDYPGYLYARPIFGQNFVDILL